ncbi:hypothetical protein XAC908_580012 [Xanthomonas citri pv. citri]|nr:hypothetical protein XAC908_580012 [Xanthomonas citri pv. citri]
MSFIGACPAGGVDGAVGGGGVHRQVPVPRQAKERAKAARGVVCAGRGGKPRPSHGRRPQRLRRG